MILLEEFQKVNEVVVHRLEAEWKQTAIVSNLDLLLFSLFLRLCNLCRFCIALSFFGILLFKHGTILGFQCVKLLFDFISFLVDVALLSTAHSETTLPLMFRPIGDLTLLAAVRSLEASVATRIIIWYDRYQNIAFFAQCGFWHTSLSPCMNVDVSRGL